MILAFSLMTLFLVSTMVLSSTMQKLHDTAREHLISLRFSTKSADHFISTGYLFSTTTFIEKQYGNDTREIYIEPLTILSSDFQNAWGRDNCDPRISFDISKIKTYFQGVDLGVGNISTDIEVRNGFVYITADSSTALAPDLYIVDATLPSSPYIVSSINTGPGLSALEVAGHYVYTANLGTTNQLQIIDIENRNLPAIISKTKLPLLVSSSSPPKATAIFYNKGLIYLGTEKWSGNELSVFDVSDPYLPTYLGGFKTNTLINDIYVRDGVAYLATSDQNQMRVLDVSDPTSISLVESFSPSGWQTQEGKTISYFEKKMSLGRTTGGFNNILNPEIFIFSTTSPLKIEYFHDIHGGVYGIIMRSPYIYLATRSPAYEFQVWDMDLSKKISEIPLNFLPHGFVCDGSDFYFGTGNRKGFGVITTK